MLIATNILETSEIWHNVFMSRTVFRFSILSTESIFITFPGLNNLHGIPPKVLHKILSYKSKSQSIKIGEKNNFDIMCEIGITFPAPRTISLNFITFPGLEIIF